MQRGCVKTEYTRCHAVSPASRLAVSLLAEFCAPPGKANNQTTHVNRLTDKYRSAALRASIGQPLLVLSKLAQGLRNDITPARALKKQAGAGAVASRKTLRVK